VPLPSHCLMGTSRGIHPSSSLPTRRRATAQRSTAVPPPAAWPRGRWHLTTGLTQHEISTARSALGPHGTGNRWSSAGTNGHGRHPRTAGHQARTPPSLGERSGATAGSSPLTQLPQACGPANEAGSHRGSASPITHSMQNRMRLDHPDDHPADPSGSVGSRLDRQPTQREQARSVCCRPVGRGAFDS
jgi:hypothetical protein